MDKNTKITTYNESDLHNSLKTFYAALYKGKKEVKIDNYYYDVACKNNLIIEIQTKNLGKLKDKITDTLNKGIKIILVHPIIIQKKIELVDENLNRIRIKKSPKKENLYDIFKELTKLYPILLHKNFTLELVFINMIETRTDSDTKLKINKKKSRYHRDYVKINKKLEEIIGTKQFKTKEDYLSLLPKTLDKEFCAKDLQRELKKTKDIPFRVYNNPHIILWLFVRMNIIEYVYTKKSKYYKKI